MSSDLATVITLADVDQSLTRAKAGLRQAADEVVWQIENAAWHVKGYADWDTMREAEYGGAAFMVPTAERKELVARLRSAGMTQKQIAATAGVDQSTVGRDLNMQMQDEDSSTTITNSRGQRRPATHARPTKPTDSHANAPRPGVSTWSRRVQTISATIPMTSLSTDEVRELLGAAIFLRDYCTGELIRRDEA